MIDTDRPPRDRRRSTRLAGLAALLLAPFATVAVPAVAEDGFVEEVRAPGPERLRLEPGSSTSREVLVRNGSGATAGLHLMADNVVDDENGCVRPEIRDGDTTCDSSGGELGRWLRLRIDRVAPDGPRETVWNGTLSDLEGGVVLVEALPAGSRQRLGLVSLLPREARNNTMTDRVSYDLRWTITSQTGREETEVLGVDAASGATTSGGRTPEVGLPGLPTVGGDLPMSVLVITAAALGTGSFLLALGRRRPDLPESV